MHASSDLRKANDSSCDNFLIVSLVLSFFLLVIIAPTLVIVFDVWCERAPLVEKINRTKAPPSTFWILSFYRRSFFSSAFFIACLGVFFFVALRLSVYNLDVKVCVLEGSQIAFYSDVCSCPLLSVCVSCHIFLPYWLELRFSLGICEYLFSLAM